MAPEPFVGGYFLYLLEIFLPGLGFGSLLQLWKKEDGLLDRLGLALGLGLSVDTFVLMLRTSNIVHISGIDTYTLYGIMLAGAVALAASLLFKKSKLSVPKLSRTDLILMVLLLVQSAMLLLYFGKYPIFPEYQSQDYSVHVTLAEGLISGSTVSIPGGILYYGIHYQLASGILLVGGEPLITARQIMALLVVLSSLLFYSATKRIFSSSRAALICSSIYVLSGTIWFASVFDSGLFANFYGILSALFLIIALLGVIHDFRAPASWIIFLIAVINAYFSHYTLLTILPAILLIPLLQFFHSSKNRSATIEYLIPSLVIVVPALIPLAIDPSLGSRILFLAASGGGVLAGNTALSAALSSIPVLGYLALEIFDDYALIVLILLTVVYLYFSIRSRNPIFFLPVFWFLSLLIAAPNDTSAWRFSYEAIVPLTLMASFGLSSILPDSSIQTRGKSSMAQRTKSAQKGSTLPRIFIFLVLFGGIVIGSWGTSMVSDSLTQTALVSQSQYFVYNAIYWLRNNTANNSQYLSVSDWRFTYTNLIIGRPTFYQYAPDPTEAMKIARNDNANYIIVTNITTLALSGQPSLYPWNNFPTNSGSSNLTLLFQNSDVRIYEITNFT